MSGTIRTLKKPARHTAGELGITYGLPRLLPLPSAADDGSVTADQAIKVSIANKVLTDRHALGLSQVELARLAGIQVAVLNRIERGTVMATIPTLEKIERALLKARKRSESHQAADEPVGRLKPRLARVLEVDQSGAVSFKARRLEGIKQPPRLRETLNEQTAQRAEHLYRRLINEFLGYTRERWIDGFLRDDNPDDELRIWEKIADVSDNLWLEPPTLLKSLTKKQVRSLVLQVSMGMVDIPAFLKGITDDQVSLAKQIYGNASDDALKIQARH